jgi:hypothetical protein
MLGQWPEHLDLNQQHDPQVPCFPPESEAQAEEHEEGEGPEAEGQPDGQLLLPVVQVVDQEVLELVGREVAQEWGPEQEAVASQDQERDHAYDWFFPSAHFYGQDIVGPTSTDVHVLLNRTRSGREAQGCSCPCSRRAAGTPGRRSTTSAPPSARSGVGCYNTPG